MKTQLRQILAICDSGLKSGLQRCRPFLKMPGKNFLTRLLLALLGVFFLLTAGVGVGIYAKGARGRFIQFWSNGIPYPAGLAKWQVILYSDYLKDLSALERYYLRQEEATGLPKPEEGILEKAVMDRMVRNLALRAAAKEKNLRVARDELGGELQKVISQVGTKEEAEALLKDLYGWDAGTFSERALLYLLLEEKLLAAYGSSAELEVALNGKISKLNVIRFFGK
ncbi:hypothetical protein HYT45_01585 [Candidatus Uhrbacteria bacterium]|nr:hypothetical protein [Candidatus Uhrbacteria bacterium]